MPTYNVEKYFRECLDSVVNQTLVDIEIIPVDDGSPDNCGKIMDEYAQKDSRIKPIHKQNGGYGSAVNAGIEAAQGEYIGIVETDDVCEPDMFEKLYNQAKKFDADVCKCSFYQYNSLAEKQYQNKKWQSKYQYIECCPDDRSFKITEFPLLLNFHSSIWTNIYKKKFLINNNIRVNDTKSASYQDLPFMVECMCKADRIAVVHDYLYHWRNDEGQNSSTIRTDDRLLIMAYQCELVKQFVKENGLYEDLKEVIYKHFYHCNYKFFKVIDWKYKKEYFNKLHNLYVDLAQDKHFAYKYFNKREKRNVLNLVNNNYIIAILPLLRREVFQLRFNNQEKYIKLLGVKIKL